MNKILQWEISNHCCQACFGRVLSRALPPIDGEPNPLRVYRCADCGIEAQGHTAAVVCTCGFKVTGRKIGLKCEPNSQKTAEFPAEIIARQA